MNRDSLRARLAGPLAVFVLMIALLVPAHWKAIQNANIEQGDMAANSILIQDAKSFHLLIGNYSRIGFNHPGPAILYCLAAGEVVFYDRLHLTPTPMGGQMLGAIVYAATWTALIWTILRRMAGSDRTAILYVAIFLAATSVLLPKAFVWIWPPDLYYFPFATFVLALSEFIRGRADSLLAMAVSWGFLLNGHVSFFAITAIMVLTGLAANWLLARGAANSPVRVLSREFLLGHWIRIALSIVIMVLFLTPLAIETFIHYPGPVSDYATYSHNNFWNNPISSVLFVAYYWGGIFGYAAGIAVVGAIFYFGRLRDDAPVIHGLAAALFAATVGTLFYAVVGVDDTSERYIGFFYYAVPTFAAVLVAHYFLRWNSWDRKPGVRVGLPILATVLTGALIYFEVAPVPGNDCNPQIADLYAQMKTLGPPPLLLDLDGSNSTGSDWGKVWTRLAGVENYAKRQGVLPFLITKNWQILFTKRALYSGPPLPPNRYLVSAADRPGAAIRSYGLSFYKVAPFSLEPGRPYQIASDKLDFAENLLGPGWSVPEADFVWSQAKENQLTLPYHLQTAVTLDLDMGAYLPASTTQHIEVTANGVHLGGATFNSIHNRGVRSFTIPAGLGDPVTVSIVVATPHSPRRYEFSSDSRKLGVSLYGLELRAATDPSSPK